MFGLLNRCAKSLSATQATALGIARLETALTSVFSYRAPTDPEKQRDFLWRHHRDVPGVGEVVIFNRSHYEAVLIEWVHGWIDDARKAIKAHVEWVG